MTKQRKSLDKKAIVSYIIGFILSLILTIVPFMLVINGIIVSKTLIFVTLAFAVAQLVVQGVFFLHLVDEEKPYYLNMSFLYTILNIAIIVLGTIWIMFSLNHLAMMAH